MFNLRESCKLLEVEVNKRKKKRFLKKLKTLGRLSYDPEKKETSSFSLRKEIHLECFSSPSPLQRKFLKTLFIFAGKEEKRQKPKNEWHLLTIPTKLEKEDSLVLPVQSLEFFSPRKPLSDREFLFFKKVLFHWVKRKWITEPQVSLLGED
jgi:hypothetical protein